jgi:hypothetical protein
VSGTRLRALLLPAAFLLALAPAAPLTAADPLDVAVRREITAAEAQKVAFLLAGPRFLGRGTGQVGNDDAATWLAGELAKAGWAPGPAAPSGKDGKPAPADFLQPFEVPAARAGTDAPAKTANVVGVLEGTVGSRGTATPSADPGKPAGPAPAPGTDGVPPAAADPPRETVVLGAHFDHLGVRGGTGPDGKPTRKSVVFWGADDNASGTTAVLLVARALGRMAKDGVHPRRTAVMVFFSGEEVGLLGSKHYVERPVRPLADTVAMINLDMVGRNATRYLEVYGNATSPELDAWNRRAAEETKVECTYPPPALFQRSDQWSFYEAKIPALFLHGGLHNDYHTPRDVPEELNYAKVALVARHAAEVLWLALNEPKRPTFRAIDMKGAGGRLGIAVDPCTPEEHGALGLDEKTSAVKVAAVFAGGLAEKLLQPGDLVYSWNEFPLYADDPVGRFQAFVDAARAGEQVVLRYLRGKERRAAAVKF